MAKPLIHEIKYTVTPEIAYHVLVVVILSQVVIMHVKRNGVRMQAACAINATKQHSRFKVAS